MDIRRRYRGAVCLRDGQLHAPTNLVMKSDDAGMRSPSPVNGDEDGGVQSGVNRTAVHSLFIVLSCIVCVFSLVALGTTYAGQMMESEGNETLVVSSEDLSGDDEPDRVISKSWNLDSPEPGEVRVETAGGTILFRGIEDDDRFGEVVNPMVDLNGNGHKDLIVGAPGIDRGEVYVFFGPFDEHHPEVRNADDADLIFFSPHPEEYDFGARAAPIVDLTGNGFPEIRIGAWRDDQFGEPISRTYIFRGDTGEPLYFVLGDEPFDAWPWIEADVNDDGVVDQIDMDIAIANLGRTDDVTRMDGDVNEDGEVSQLDLDIIGSWTGLNPIYNNPISDIIGIPKPIDPCDGPTPPAGLRCIDDCDGDSITLPDNVTPMCDPPSTCQAYCDVTMSGPEPATTPIGGLQSVQFHSTSLSNSTFEVIYGIDPYSDQRIIYFDLPSASNNYTFEYMAISNGPVTIRVWNEVCTYVCEEEFTFFITDDQDDSSGNGVQDWIENCMGTDPFDFYTKPDMEVDSDNDGLPDWYEICVLNSDPNNPDTSGNGIPDGWLYQNGFSIDDFGIAWVDTNGNGIPNLLEFLYGTDPNDPDSFLNATGLPPDSNGNGYIDWFEEVLGSDPSDPDIVPEVVFTPGDMIWAIVDGVFMQLESEFLDMCVGDNFRLHATGTVDSWKVLQGQDLLTEVSENPSNSCWSGLWHINGAGTILIAGATPHSNGDVTLGYALITADECDDDGDDCDIELTLPGGEELPEFVCAGQQIELTASGADGGDGEFEWHVMEHAAIIGPTTGDTILLEIEEPGEIILTVNKGDCGEEISLTAKQFTLVIDSTNELGFDVPEYDEESDIDPMESPGKIIFTNIGDSDNDGIPDYADGYDLATTEGNSSSSQAQFTPMVLHMDPKSNPEEYKITFLYSQSDPSDVQVNQHGTVPYNWNEYELPSAERFRLWTEDGDQLRSPLSISEGGNFIHSGVDYDLADLIDDITAGPFVIYIEAVRPSWSPGDDTIDVTLTNYEKDHVCSASVRVTAVEVEVHDLRHWDLEWHENTDVTVLSNPSLLDETLGSQVGGAITDGSSVCLLRLRPHMKELPPALWGIEVQAQRADDVDVSQPRVVGTLWPTAFQLEVLPMPLPTPWSDVVNTPGPSGVDFTAGLALYVPPDNYLDPIHNTNTDAVLNSEETCDLVFAFYLDNQRLGVTPFALRRPPLILVHGANSGAGTWDSQLWGNNSQQSPTNTRVYAIDYSDSVGLGYDDNWAWIPWQIQTALRDYREASDMGAVFHPAHGFQGIRYAANRADVVTHSMGSILTRLYMSDLQIQDEPRQKEDGNGNWVPNDKWHEINVPRVPQPDNILTEPSVVHGNVMGRWWYLRSQNYGVGDVRRFVSIGAPFNGSPLGDVGRDLDFGKHWVGRAVGETLQWLRNEGQPIAFVIDVDLLVSPALIDLGPNSTFQRLLEQANYPAKQSKYHWHPVVGVAGSIPPSFWQKVWWNGVFATVAGSDLNVANAGQGDLVVHMNSQANGRIDFASVIGDTVHWAFPGMEEHFGVQAETASSPVANRIREILATYNPSHWEGDLSQ